jgi:hypothetical protein
MKRYGRLLWLLVSSLFSAFVGYLLALAITLPFVLRYASGSVEPPPGIMLLMQVVGFSLPTLSFLLVAIRLWRWADASGDSTNMRTHKDTSRTKGDSYRNDNRESSS